MSKIYFIMRKDLNMSPAKLAVQIGHGMDYAYGALNIYPEILSDRFIKWVENQRKKIVLEINNKEKLETAKNKLSEQGIIYFSIIDNGLTEFDGKTNTGIIILPISDDKIPKYIKRLRLYS